MGFGTLFIGYFLLFNIPYFGMTDVIAATVMMAGLYKLSTVNRSFKLGYFVSLVFTVFSIPELVIFALDLFKITEGSDLLSYLRVGQCVIVCALTVLILLGIAEVTREVDLPVISKRSRRLIYVTFAVYLLWIACNAPFISALFGGYVPYVYLVAILALFILVFCNLVTIYGCYMRICMPGEENGRKGKIK